MVEKNPTLHVSESLKKLATPWHIALERAKRVNDKNLNDGYILDLACGSGIQLAAYSIELNKPCIGIEINKERAKTAEKTLKNILNKNLFENSKIICGDCLNPSELGINKNIKFSLIHLDPARPTDIQKHIISEMEPSPIEAIRIWKKVLTEDGRIILDLSPRLSEKQCKDLDSKLGEILPELKRTWEWSSQGRGRIDRLSIWIEGTAVKNISARYIRNHPKEINESIVIQGEKLPWERDEKTLEHKEVKINDFVSIVDPVLISSGLENDWVVSQNFDGDWIRKNGRRPLFLHSDKFDLKNSDRNLIFESGQIKEIIDCDISENVEKIIKIANKLELMKLTLRLKIDPKLHPKIQSKIDKNLINFGGSGFIINLPNNAIAICSKI